jgi:hypothetical protein
MSSVDSSVVICAAKRIQECLAVSNDPVVLMARIITALLQETAERLELVEHETPSGVSESEFSRYHWIDTKEKLPKRGLVVLIASSGGVIGTGYITEDRDWLRSSPGAFSEQPEVTHWMPLPEPPQSGRAR